MKIRKCKKCCGDYTGVFRGFFMEKLFFIVFAMLLVLPFSAFAEIKEIISEGTYNMGDGETPTVAESMAVLQAKRTALEQAGTYVESYSKVENFQLTKDEIQVLASGIMDVTILDKKRTIVGDGIHFWVKIKARVNSDKIQEMATKVKEKSVVEDYKKIQAAYDKSQKEIEELKKQLAQAKGEREKKKIEVKITDTGNLFQAFEWFEKGNKYSLNNEFEQAIDAYSRSLEFGIKIYETYTKRGIAYANKGDFDSAIKDFDTVIELYSSSPLNYGTDNKTITKDMQTDHTVKYASAYYNRGGAYAKKGQLKKALDDFNKAITINPSIDENVYYWVYYTRGKIYAEMALYDKAIDEYSKAIKLRSDEGALYIDRGASYSDNGQYDLAIEDYTKAIELSADKISTSLAYGLRGIAYSRKGQHDRAIEDFTKAITLNSYYENYKNRGIAYAKKEQYEMAFRDFDMAVSLYQKDADLYVRRGATGAAVGNFGKAMSDFQKACDMGDERGCNALHQMESVINKSMGR